MDRHGRDAAGRLAAGEPAPDARAEQGATRASGCSRRPAACSRAAASTAPRSRRSPRAAGFSTGRAVLELRRQGGPLPGADGARDRRARARDRARRCATRASVAERATGGARQWMTMIEREPELLLLFMEFWAYGVRDAEVRPKVAERFAQMRQAADAADRRRRARVRPRAGAAGRAARDRDRRARRRHRPPEAGRPRARCPTS